MSSFLTYLSTLLGLCFGVNILSEEDVSTFTIITDQKGPVIPDEFLSVTIDASLVENFEVIDFSSPLFNLLSSGLSPAIWRYGGTHADETCYYTNGTISSFKYLYCTYTTRTVQSKQSFFFC